MLMLPRGYLDALASGLFLGAFRDAHGRHCDELSEYYRQHLDESSHRILLPCFVRACALIRSINQALIAPSMIPLAKYFCTKGYTRRIGTVVTVTAAICTDSR